MTMEKELLESREKIAALNVLWLQLKLEGKEDFADFVSIVIDGLKKYQWHDVVDHPNDMPEDFERVLVYYEYYRYGNIEGMYRMFGIGEVIDGKFAFVDGVSVNKKTKVLAWKYFDKEPFEEGYADAF